MDVLVGVGTSGGRHDTEVAVLVSVLPRWCCHLVLVVVVVVVVAAAAAAAAAVHRHDGPA